MGKNDKGGTKNVDGTLEYSEYQAIKQKFEKLAGHKWEGGWTPNNEKLTEAQIAQGEPLKQKAIRDLQASSNAVPERGIKRQEGKWNVTTNKHEVDGGAPTSSSATPRNAQNTGRNSGWGIGK